jgi:copper chaperone CopZ
MLLPVVLSFFCLFPFPYSVSFHHVSPLARGQQSRPHLHQVVSPGGGETPREIDSNTTGSVYHSTKENQRDSNAVLKTKTTSDSPYNLLWSPGMLRKVAWTGLGLAMAHRFGPRLIPASVLQGLRQHHTLSFLSLANSPIHCWMHQLGLPLLASACCLLQLVLNALSVGCAGFNKHLGPVRPYFVSLLLYLSIVEYYSGSSRRRPLQLLLRWTIALLPELLFAWNNNNNRMIVRKQRPRNNNAVDDQRTTTTIRLEVPTMGCVACINAIQNAVSRVEGVESVSSHLLQETGGETVVRLSSSPDGTSVAVTEQMIVQAIADSGFPGAKVMAQSG